MLAPDYYLQTGLFAAAWSPTTGSCVTRFRPETQWDYDTAKFEQALASVRLL
jgi:hypothetical protein